MIPFANGTQYADWTEENCEKCTKGAKYTKYGRPIFKCDLQKLIDAADEGDGSVAPSVAERMNLNKDTKSRYVWTCNEFDKSELAERREIVAKHLALKR